MAFDPKTNKYPYTEYTDQHYLHVKKNNGLKFDQNYPFIDTSFGFRFRQFLTRIVLILIVFPVTYIRLGLKIVNKSNIRKYKDVLDKGVISVANHVHMWDYLAVMCAIRPHWSNILSWATNIRGENASLIRMVGGIPIPDDSVHGTAAYVKAVGKLLSDGGWLHIAAEGSMWEYYAPIRPFKRGCSAFAVSFDKPILPLGFSYREPGWIRKKIFHQIACFTLTVGEPVYADKSLPPKEQEVDLTKRVHAAVCRLSGIDPEKNPYPPIFDRTKRIDYYTTEYGVGYKGSW